MFQVLNTMYSKDVNGLFLTQSEITDQKNIENWTREQKTHIDDRKTHSRFIRGSSITCRILYTIQTMATRASQLTMKNAMLLVFCSIA